MVPGGEISIILPKMHGRYWELIQGVLMENSRKNYIAKEEKHSHNNHNKPTTIYYTLEK